MRRCKALIYHLLTSVIDLEPCVITFVSALVATQSSSNSQPNLSVDNVKNEPLHFCNFIVLVVNFKRKKKTTEKKGLTRFRHNYYKCGIFLSPANSMCFVNLLIL